MSLRRFDLLVIASLLATFVACSEASDDTTTACSADSGCPEGLRCLPDGSCADVECLDEADCVEKDPRQTCNEDRACEFREGFGDECSETELCEFGQFCSTLLGLCLDAASARDCARNTQCPSGQICDRTANKCVTDLGCFGDDFCEEGETCDLVNNTCVSAGERCESCTLGCEDGIACFESTQECVPLGDNPVCRQGEQCDPTGRCVQCFTTDDCGPGTFCNASVGRCESNVQCAIDPSQCPSTSEVQCILCELPQVCDIRTKQCAAPAQPCDSDLDCPNDQICDQSLSPSVCVPRLPDCINDIFDSPSNDLPVTARTLNLFDGPLFDEIRLCPGDQDWFALDVSAGTLLTVDARFLHGEGDLEMQLLLEDGTSILDQSRTTTDNERVELEVGTDLRLLLRTFLGTQTVRPLDYSLVVAADPGETCPDDVEEPNDSVVQATPLLFDQIYDGRLCTADPDWFVLRLVPEGARVDLSLDFADALGDLDLEVYRAGAQVPLAVSAGFDDGERLSFDAPFGGDFFLRVVGKGPDNNVYQLRATLRPGEGGSCRDDTYEANESPLVARPLDSVLGIPQALSLCSEDEDWFEITADPFTVLRAGLTFTPGEDLDLALYEPGTTERGDTPVALSDGLNPAESINHLTFEGGAYLLRVYGARASDASNYTLTASVESPFECEPDANDVALVGNTRDLPIFFGIPPRTVEASLCVADEDWYQIFLEGGLQTTLRLEYADDLANLEFELYQTGPSPIVTTLGQTFEDLREVNLNVDGVGFAAATIRVFSTAGTAPAYTLRAVTTPVFTCNPDASEPSESPEAASRLTVGSSVISLPGLSLCPGTRRPAGGGTVGDEDYFVLEPPTVGTQMEASVSFESGDLLLELLGPGTFTRACQNEGDDRCYSDGNNLTEMVTFTATTTQPYILRVSSVFSSPAGFVPVDADTSYDLEVRYIAP